MGKQVNKIILNRCKSCKGYTLLAVTRNSFDNASGHNRQTDSCGLSSIYKRIKP